MQNLGWIVAVVIALGAAAYIWWPTTAGEALPVVTEQTAQTQQQPVTAQSMAGMWRSNSDAKFTREFRADGVIYDRYEGDATAGAGGSWGIVLDLTRESALTVPAESLAGKTVVKATWENGVEVTYFSVDTLSPTSMTITDLSGRGGVTVFTKI